MTKNNNSVLIKLLSEKPIAFSPTISRAVGSITAGLMLQQLLYWTGKEYDQDGWIYKSFKEMEYETSLTEKQQEGAVKKLVQFKLIEVESREKGQWKTSRRFRVVGGVETVAKFVGKKIDLHVPKGEMGDSKRGDGPSDKRGDVLYTENTRTENTNIATPEAPQPAKRTKLDPNEPQTLEQFVASCAANPRRSIQIIGKWAETVNPGFSTRGEWGVFLKRCLRPADNLAPFSEEKLQNAFERLEEAIKAGWLTTYSLDTLLKFTTNTYAG